MDYELMFILLCVINAVLFIAVAAQMRENGKLSAKVQSLGRNQDDTFKEIDQLALKVQTMKTDLYSVVMKPPVVKQAQPKRSVGRPRGSTNKKGATK